jgi:hypothetical protein
MFSVPFTVSLLENEVPPSATPIELRTINTTAAPAVTADPRTIGRGPVRVVS